MLFVVDCNVMIDIFFFYINEQGHPRLVKILSKLYGQLQQRELDPMTNVRLLHIPRLPTLVYIPVLC